MIMQHLFKLFTSFQKASATSIYKQRQSNLLVLSNLFYLITLEPRTEKKMKTPEICNIQSQSITWI